jgi:Holliday junction resolvase RusA-like endonuclease
MKIRIYGNPAPQGSKTAIVRNGRAIMFESNKRLPEWRDTVLMGSTIARAEHGGLTILGPVTVTMTFHMPRPKSTSRRYPNSAPDLDKLVRAVGDALQESEVLANDGQIVTLMAHKVYAENEAYSGVEIEITEKP